MRYFIPIIFLFLQGCSYVLNVKPPFADPANLGSYATLKIAAISPGLSPSLSKIDGQYASSSPLNGPRDVQVMYVMPGIHSVTAYCSTESNLAYTVGVGIEIKFSFAKGEEYLLACDTDKTKTQIKFLLKESGKEIPYEIVRWLIPGGGSYK
jgi:hypothetical protein